MLLGRSGPPSEDVTDCDCDCTPTSQHWDLGRQTSEWGSPGLCHGTPFSGGRNYLQVIYKYPEDLRLWDVPPILPTEIANVLIKEIFLRFSNINLPKTIELKIKICPPTTKHLKIILPAIRANYSVSRQ